MSSLLFVEAFGQLFRDENLEGIVSEDAGDLYSVFDARAELMGWSTTSARRRPLLWHMNEAKLTAGIDEYRIGYVQVGLDVGDVERTRVPVSSWPVLGYRYAPLGVNRSTIEPAVVLPAVIQCFDDALRRFGVVEVSGLQVTANFLNPWTQSYASDLVSGLNWFNTTMKGQADALIAFDQEFLGGRSEAELVSNLGRRNTGSFKFGPVVSVPEQHSVKVGVEAPIRSIIAPRRSGLGLSVSLPEWTASTAAWVLAMVIDTARVSAPDVSNFAVRVTRVVDGKRDLP